MKYYLKNCILPILYLFFMAVTSLGILAIQGDNLVWLQVLLCVLNLGLYEVIVCAFSYNLGQEAIKVRYANDLERKRIIETGESRPLNLKEEYKPYKGFLLGVGSCAPLIILLLIHTVMILCGGGNGFGIAASMLYLVVYCFFRLNGTSEPTAGTFYFSLFALPLIIVSMGVAYNLGARKIILQHKKIEAQQREIYGDKN